MVICGKTIEIIKAENADAPLVILNEYAQTSGEVYSKCKELGCPDFALAEITGLNWNDDLSPWKVAPLRKSEAPFGGKADEYLQQLLRVILPAVKAESGAQPRRILLAGYSLAGLFALYAATKCGDFAAIASCSGSMWYPGFKEYVMNCEVANLPKAMYFSLGDREARTKNEILRAVEDNTREIAGYFSENGINTVFELNKGNHFQQGALRTAKGIKWMLENTG